MPQDYRRRKFLKVAGITSVVGATGLAGCLGDDDSGDGDETPTPTPDEDGDPIPMGSILPITGNLEDLGGQMQEAVNLAVDHVNDAGGPLDREIDMNNMDSETTAAAGQDRYDTLVTQDEIVAFVGAASSGVSAPIAQDVASDQVMQISPASTSPVFVDYGWDENEELKYFGRTAPNDAQQGLVIARTVDMYLEADSVAFLYVDNPYGEGGTEVASGATEAEVLAEVGYDEASTDFGSALDSLFADDPDTVVFIGYPQEARPMFDQYQDLGYSADWVLSEGLDSTEFIEEYADVLEGEYLTTPDPEATEGSEIFQDVAGHLDGPFDPHSYDALMIAALAIEAAGEASGTAISENFLEVCNPPGEVVTVDEFEEAKQLIADGEDIQYQGASSPLEMNEDYENLNQFAIMQITDGATETVEVLEREWFM